MTMISNYYAQVGIKIDKKSIKDVSSFLGNIEKTLAKFQKKLGTQAGQKATQIRVGVTLDKGALGHVRNQLNALSKNLTLNISQVALSRQGVNRAMKGAVSNSAKGLMLNASLSASSVATIRTQVQNALSGLHIGAPRVTGGMRGVGASGGSTAARSGRVHPWYNPMQIGGGTGAFIRYGMYSLPFVGGAMGLNAAANNMATLQATQMNMNTAFGSREGGAQAMSYLSNLGNRLGFRTSDVAPQYAQMAAGARGTALESQLPEGFESFMEYASVTGMNAEQIKGATRA